jgi:hypothetical protein
MIPSDHINNPGKTTYLKAKLTGAPLKGFDLDGGRQAFKDNTVEILFPSSNAAYSLPYEGKDMDQALLPAPLVQSDDPRIQEQARKIVGKERDATKAARLLNEWVYAAIRKKPVVSIPSAVEVLNQRVDGRVKSIHGGADRLEQRVGIEEDVAYSHLLTAQRELWSGPRCPPAVRP